MSESEPKEQTNKISTGWLIATIVFIIAIVWLFSSLGDSGRTPIPTPRPTTFEIMYQVRGEGTDRASLTIENETGGTEQTDVFLPWMKRFTAEAGQFVYISAQNDSDGGSISCLITADDEVIESAESDGAFAIASCSGSVGR